MIDTLQMEKEFIERRKKHNEILKKNQSGFAYRSHYNSYFNQWDSAWEECKPFRLNEEPLDENPPLMTITYKGGKGGVVLDMNEFSKLSESKQRAILALGEVNEDGKPTKRSRKLFKQK